MGLAHTHKIERLEVVEGRPHREQTFFIRPGSRRGKWQYFRGAEVPEFEGAHAFFEIQRDGHNWIFLRQVPNPRG